MVAMKGWIALCLILSTSALDAAQDICQEVLADLKTALSSTEVDGDAGNLQRVAISSFSKQIVNPRSPLGRSLALSSDLHFYRSLDSLFRRLYEKVEKPETRTILFSKLAAIQEKLRKPFYEGSVEREALDTKYKELVTRRFVDAVNEVLSENREINHFTIFMQMGGSGYRKRYASDKELVGLENLLHALKNDARFSQRLTLDRQKILKKLSRTSGSEAPPIPH